MGKGATAQGDTWGINLSVDKSGPYLQHHARTTYTSHETLRRRARKSPTNRHGEGQGQARVGATGWKEEGSGNRALQEGWAWEEEEAEGSGKVAEEQREVEVEVEWRGVRSRATLTVRSPAKLLLLLHRRQEQARGVGGSSLRERQLAGDTAVLPRSVGGRWHQRH